jgi:acetyl-CoA acetyltransferase
MESHVYVIGIGLTPFGSLPDHSVKSLARLALDNALADAGCTRADVGAVFFANAGQGFLEGQTCVRGQVALRAAGLQGIPITNVENACAGGSTAFHAAVNWLRAERGDVALAIGVEKMVIADRARAMSLFEGGWDVGDVEAGSRTLRELEAGTGALPAAPAATAQSRFMEIYGALARFYMSRFGVTREQLATVAAKNHAHSVHNPLAHYRKPFTIDEVLDAREVVWPLTVPMCSPLSDGAAAAVLCTERALGRFGTRRAVRVLASVLRSGSDRNAADVENHVSHLAARSAYEEAGVGPEDVSVAEVHDATALGEIIQVENLGFCAFGFGGELAVRGDTRLGGRIPVNPSGGLESRGHPIAATGLAQIHELVTQLRGDAGPRQVAAARIAVAENGGGLIGVEEAVACLTVLGR